MWRRCRGPCMWWPTMRDKERCVGIMGTNVEVLEIHWEPEIVTVSMKMSPGAGNFTGSQ